jgi:uncharacterized protein YijF (DUF1287 family)
MIATKIFTAKTQSTQGSAKEFTLRFLCDPCALAVKRFSIRLILCTITVSLTLVHAHAQSDFASRLSNSAIELTKQRVYYDGAYFSIPYPNGDVPSNRGVCTDVVIRAYRKLGIDLQQKVHEDMKANFTLYPKIWGLKKTDTNIDHRRVPNLMTFFSRHGVKLKNTQTPADYKPGDLVTWDLGGNTPHIGIVIDQRSSDNTRPLIVHNIGAGQEISDCLFTYRITGHYRYPSN